MCIESVENIEGGVRHYFHGAITGCCEELQVGRRRGCDVMGEGGGIGLDGLRVRSESCVGCCDRFRGQIRFAIGATASVEDNVG